MDRKYIKTTQPYNMFYTYMYSCFSGHICILVMCNHLLNYSPTYFFALFAFRFASAFIYVHCVMQPDNHLFSYPAGFKPLTLWYFSACCIVHMSDSVWLEVSTHSPTLKESKAASVINMFLSSSPGCSFKQVKCCKGWAAVSLTSFSCQGFSLTETREQKSSRVIELFSLKCTSRGNHSSFIQSIMVYTRTVCIMFSIWLGCEN